MTDADVYNVCVYVCVSVNKSPTGLAGLIAPPFTYLKNSYGVFYVYSRTRHTLHSINQTYTMQLICSTKHKDKQTTHNCITMHQLVLAHRETPSERGHCIPWQPCPRSVSSNRLSTRRKTWRGSACRPAGVGGCTGEKGMCSFELCDLTEPRAAALVQTHAQVDVRSPFLCNVPEKPEPDRNLVSPHMGSFTGSNTDRTEPQLNAHTSTDINASN